MSIRRWAARVDTTQKEIVKALRAAGYHVELMRQPVDLAVRHPTWPVNRWFFAEAKTARGKKKPSIAVDKRRRAQNEFIEKHSVPRWTSAEQALKAVGEVV